MNNRETILENALILFASFGYDATGVQEICDQSGITKPTLYHYFRSKRGLMEDLLKENYTPYIKRLKDACEYRRDLPQNIAEVLRSTFHFAESNLLFYKLQFSMRNAPARGEAYDIIKPWIKAQHEPVLTLFSAAEKDNGNMRGRAQAYTITLLGMANAYIQQAVEEDIALNEELAYQARQQFMYGIFS
jgi:TetR/AcrR family transcriptional regulator